MFVSPACMFHYPLYDEEQMFNQTKWRNQGRLFLILHHQEVHLILPNLYRVLVYSLKHMTVKLYNSKHVLSKNNNENDLYEHIISL